MPAKLLMHATLPLCFTSVIGMESGESAPPDSLSLEGLALSQLQEPESELPAAQLSVGASTAPAPASSAPLRQPEDQEGSEKQGRAQGSSRSPEGQQAGPSQVDAAVWDALCSNRSRMQGAYASSSCKRRPSRGSEVPHDDST